MSDHEAVRDMLGLVPVRYVPMRLSRCAVDWAQNSIYLNLLGRWAQMTPAARRQLVRITRVEKDDVPEAWDAFNKAIEGDPSYFVPRLMLGRTDVLYLQAFSGPDREPPSEVHLAEMLSDALARYAGPEHAGDRHDVRYVEVTAETTMVAVTSSSLLILDREEKFVHGYCARASEGEVMINRFWHYLDAHLSFIFNGSGDTITSYARGDIRGAMRRAGIGIAHNQGKRFEAHTRALRAASKCPERDPPQVIDRLREQHVPNTVLDMVSERLPSPGSLHGLRLSVAQAISYVAEKSVVDPELRLTLQKAAGAYLLNAPKP